jgi:hypothetical protein
MDTIYPVGFMGTIMTENRAISCLYNTIADFGNFLKSEFSTKLQLLWKLPWFSLFILTDLITPFPAIRKGLD